MNNQLTENKELIAACGLYCGACGVYLATKENDSDKILYYAVALNQTYEDTLCDGCGAKRKSLHCTKICTFVNCKQEKGVNNCVDCYEFPCESLKDFKSKMPHRAEIFESLKHMKEVGGDDWLKEMQEFFTCKQCKTANSSYHISCRKCGHTPGSEFALKHKADIVKYLAK